MVTKISAVIALCIIAAVMCKLLERYCKEQAVFVSIGACSIVLMVVMIFISPFINTIIDLFNSVGVDSAYIEVIFKALGICYITQLAYDICKDCNENALATVAELAGKTAIIVITMPLIQKLITVVSKLS